ncbi:MAG: hypothetical protein HYW50_02560 [Candidatus Diapherotrites archaeon]|nr:hypothetical protein [Candidatus Diapherotrites archaeon]
MEMWGKDYFNMEVQAYIEINKNKMGEFQFGLVSGDIHGRISKRGNEKFFEFTWEGTEELDETSGCGWLKKIEDDKIEGEFRFHGSDDSKFFAKRAIK